MIHQIYAVIYDVLWIISGFMVNSHFKKTTFRSESMARTTGQGHVKGVEG